MANPDAWNSQDTSSPLLPTIELTRFRTLGEKLQCHSITILPTLEDFTITKYNISELSKNIKTDIRTFMLYSNLQTLEYAWKTLSILIDTYTKNGSISGLMVTQITKDLHERESIHLGM